MTLGEDAPKSSFRANFLSVRTLFIFVAGFVVALLLARLLPGAALFHPEAQLHKKDIVIALLNGQTVAGIHGIATSEGESFAGTSEVWDGDLLNEAVAQAAKDLRLSIPATITYVVPRKGPVETILIERRD